MKEIIILIILFITSCVPMELKIQQAIYKTQTVEATIVPTSTLTLANTNTPFPTATISPTPTPTYPYILEVGVCPLKADKNSNPKKEGCVVEESQKIKLHEYELFEGTEIQIQNQDPYVITYCALYGINGELVDFQLDFEQTGSLFCQPN